MNDRELLELAAKAIGRCLHKNTREEHGNWGSDTYCTDCGKGTYGQHWDPLKDDADAMRLAVKLRLVVHVWDDGSTVSAAKTLPDGEDPSATSDAWFAESLDEWGCEYAATRRAIVRAAAEIGKAMP